MTRPDFPLVWDNSMRSAFVACPQKYYWEYLCHYKSQYPNVDTHAGKAFASGLEAARKAYYVDGLPESRAQAEGLAVLIRDYGNFVCPPDNPKSLNRLAEAFAYYFMVFPMETDPAQPHVGSSGPMIEFSFALPLDPNLVHPVTGEPIIYSGRADMLARYAGALSIYDDKTTKALGPQWATKWDMRAQFTGYTWAAVEYGIPVTQVLVRGISILKTKLDHAQHISSRNEFRLKRWHQQVVRDIRRAMVMWEEGRWDTDESDACESYGGCPFKQPCMHEEPQPYLDLYFEQRRWDPLTREETIVRPSPVIATPDQWQVLGNVADFKKGRK